MTELTLMPNPERRPHIRRAESRYRRSLKAFLRKQETLWPLYIEEMFDMLRAGEGLSLVPVPPPYWQQAARQLQIPGWDINKNDSLDLNDILPGILSFLRTVITRQPRRSLKLKHLREEVLYPLPDWDKIGQGYLVVQENLLRSLVTLECGGREIDSDLKEPVRCETLPLYGDMPFIRTFSRGTYANKPRWGAFLPRNTWQTRGARSRDEYGWWCKNEDDAIALACEIARQLPMAGTLDAAEAPLREIVLRNPGKISQPLETSLTPIFESTLCLRPAR